MLHETETLAQINYNPYDEKSFVNNYRCMENHYLVQLPLKNGKIYWIDT